MTTISSPGGPPQARQTYRCFLLRCRLEAGAMPGAGDGNKSSWRFTVEQTGPTAARCSFTALKDVAADLAGELSLDQESDQPKEHEYGKPTG
jgi:hypothetical protein